MIVIGDIEKIEGNKAFVKIVEHDSTYECYIMQPLTGKVKIDLPFSVGDQVVVNLQDGRNIVLGAIYNEIDQRDGEAESEKVLVKSKNFTLKTDKVNKMRAESFNVETKDGEVKLDMVNGRLVIEASDVVIDGNSVVINGGSNLGLVNILPLVAKLNALELMMNSHTHLIITPLPSSPTSNSPVQLPITTLTELEDTKVKH